MPSDSFSDSATQHAESTPATQPHSSRATAEGEVSGPSVRSATSGVSRRVFLQSAAFTGVSAVVPIAATAALPKSSVAGQHADPSAMSFSQESQMQHSSNPIVPNFQGQYGIAQSPSFQIAKRPMGKTGLQVSILGMGGFHLGTVSTQKEVTEMVAKALDHGINFFDNAWEYHGGVSEERVGVALKGRRDQAIVMTKVCTHGRKKDLAMKMLEESLTRLQTDHLDVWQVHEVIYYNDPGLAYDADGVLEALTAAKQQGKVRFVGFTGHKNPSIHLDMLNRGFPFDTVQMPINPFDPSYRSFEREVLPVAVGKGMAVFSMKSMGGSGEAIVHGALTPTEALSYAMSIPGISTTISGMDSMGVLDQNLAILQNFRPLGDKQLTELREHGRRFNDGRYELFKSTVKYDGDVGREQHHFPTALELPA
jgi:aryl-alcohol dehydrogenase-like predicted oxidoreductase